MKNNPQTWGWILVALGVLFLLQNLGFQIAGWIWGSIFLAAGAGFIWYYQQNHSQWWALIPGFTLLGLGTLILFEPILGGNLGGGVFLAAIGLGFVAVYFVRPGNWWALIPGGTLITLGAVAGSGTQNNAGGGAVLPGTGHYLWGGLPGGATLGGIPGIGLLGPDFGYRNGVAGPAGLPFPAGPVGGGYLPADATGWAQRRGWSIGRAAQGEGGGAMNAPQRLYRSRNQKMIWGICGGIAEYLNVDPTVVRLLFVLAAIVWGGGVLAYLVLYFVMPEAPPINEPEVGQGG